MQRLLAHKHLYLSLALGWTLIIALLCLVSFNELPTISIGNADKSVHFIMHLVFTVSWFLYLQKKEDDRKIILAKIFAASFLYGIFIEIAQELFTETRHADIKDVIANAIGALGGIALIEWHRRHFKRHRN